MGEERPTDQRRADTVAVDRDRRRAAVRGDMRLLESFALGQQAEMQVQTEVEVLGLLTDIKMRRVYFELALRLGSRRTFQQMPPPSMEIFLFLFPFLFLFLFLFRFLSCCACSQKPSQPLVEYANAAF
jgi:hypothetical protein